MVILSEVLHKQWTIDTANAVMRTIESCQLSCCFKYFPSAPSHQLSLRYQSIIKAAVNDSRCLISDALLTRILLRWRSYTVLVAWSAATGSPRQGRARTITITPLTSQSWWDGNGFATADPSSHPVPGSQVRARPWRRQTIIIICEEKSDASS